MKLYNTQTRQTETFEAQGDEVTIYVCGITPYDTTHLGHAFTYTSADILIRYLEYLGYEVRYVQNVTDVDDDILRKAREVGENWQALGNRWTRHFIDDLVQLNVRPPDAFPRASDVITPIIETVQALIEAGVAYESGGNVYFHIDDWPEFGTLSHLPRAEMLPIANERGNFPDDPHKRDPLDFVLWQASKEDEPGWDSPWSWGRPGWHIECSSMVREYLGDTIDFHSGGADLLFPHHECEIAQVEPVTGKSPFVRTWFHTAMVRHEGEKMSKSLGNLIMIRDLLQTWTADTLRIYMGRHHYRDAWEHNGFELHDASETARTLQHAAGVEGGDGEPLSPTPYETQFRTAMDNDLDTDKALNAMTELARRMVVAAREGHSLTEAHRALREMGDIFGLRLNRVEPEERVQTGWRAHRRKFE